MGRDEGYDRPSEAEIEFKRLFERITHKPLLPADDWFCPILGILFEIKDSQKYESGLFTFKGEYRMNKISLERHVNGDAFGKYRSQVKQCLIVIKFADKWMFTTPELADANSRNDVDNTYGDRPTLFVAFNPSIFKPFRFEDYA